jgi:hypothetical protein
MEANQKPGPLSHVNIDPHAELDVFIDDKVFTINMSGFFAKRLQAVGDWLLKSQPSEKVLVAYNQIIEKPDESPTDLFAYNIQTFLMLMQAVDKAALEQGATKKMTYAEIQESVKDATELDSDLDTGLDSHS